MTDGLRICLQIDADASESFVTTMSNNERPAL
jgi:hypothetical protein